MKTVILEIDSGIRFILNKEGRGGSIRSEGLSHLVMQMKTELLMKIVVRNVMGLR